MTVTGDAAERRRLVVIAGHRGDNQSARAALDDDDADVRASALGALERCNTLTAQDLEAAMDDGSPIVRRRAATLAAGHNDARLLTLLRDDDPSVVEVAAWACGERPDETVQRPALIAALIELAGSHDDPLCRESAVAALGALEAEEGLPAILAACSDKPAIRRRAVLALAPFDGPEVDAALEIALTDRDWQTRQAAEDLQ